MVIYTISCKIKWLKIIYYIIIIYDYNYNDNKITSGTQIRLSTDSTFKQNTIVFSCVSIQVFVVCCTVYGPVPKIKDTSRINMEPVLCHRTLWSCNLSSWLMWSTGVAAQSLLIITINNKLSPCILGGCWHSLHLGTLCRMHYAFALKPQGVWLITLSLD